MSFSENQVHWTNNSFWFAFKRMILLISIINIWKNNNFAKILRIYNVYSSSLFPMFVWLFGLSKAWMLYLSQHNEMKNKFSAGLDICLKKKMLVISTIICKSWALKISFAYSHSPNKSSFRYMEIYSKLTFK